MKFVFVSLFPDLFTSYLPTSIMGRGGKFSAFSFSVYNPRDFALDTYKHVDDTPYGGGAGMVMRPDVLERTLHQAFADQGLEISSYDKTRHKVVVLSAAGSKYTQKKASEYASLETVFLVCGRYEGIDQRFIDIYADEEISVGPYVLSGGELPALIVADSVARLLPGVLGSADSLSEESFSEKEGEEEFLEYPQYTRPAVFHNIEVPAVLVSGNHEEIRKWRGSNRGREAAKVDSI